MSVRRRGDLFHVVQVGGGGDVIQSPNHRWVEQPTRDIKFKFDSSEARSHFLLTADELVDLLDEAYLEGATDERKKLREQLGLEG